MGGKLSRTKGHSFERDTAIKLRHLFPKAMRQLEYQINCCQGIDLANTGNLAIQCKRNKKYAPISKIEEVNCTSNQIPVLVAKGDRQKTVAVLYFEDFIKILEDIGVVYNGDEKVDHLALI